MLHVLEDHALARTLGENGRESVLAKYSAWAYGKGFLAIAEQVVRGPRKDKAAAADIVLGLLKEVREAHERTTRSVFCLLLWSRFLFCLFFWSGCLVSSCLFRWFFFLVFFFAAPESTAP